MLRFESLEEKRLTASLEDLDRTLLANACAAIGWLRTQPPEAEQDNLQFDFNQDTRVNVNDVEKLLADHGTVNGDFNLDGAFDSSDFVLLFQTSLDHYQSGEANSLWFNGDADCNLHFHPSDFIYLLTQGNYEKPRAAIVTER